MEKMITENREQIDETMKTNMDEMENKMDKKMNENSSHMENKMDDMTNKIDENIQKSMKELQKSLSSMIFHALNERLSKGDIKMKGTQENKGSIPVEQPVNNK
jgi:hypothetical protein